MINGIWVIMLALGVMTAAVRPDTGVEAVTAAAISGAEQAVTTSLALIGLLAFWSGMMRIAQEAGFTSLLAKIMRPVVSRLFPGIPPEHPALGAILLSMSANLLGLGNAATPLGLKAMEEMQKLNPRPAEATDAMCTFLAITTSSLTLIPATVLALRAAAGSVDPASVIGPTIAATFCATIVGLLADRTLRRAAAARGGKRP